MIKEKAKAPLFKLPSTGKNDFNLKDALGNYIVIYFYPKDDTPGCTKEACNFRDNWTIFQNHEIKVIGISKDSANKHLNFIKKYQLPFTLLTDLEPCPVATKYESYGLKKFMGKEYMGMKRQTYVIDAEGKFELIYLKVKAASMADQIIEDLELE